MDALEEQSRAAVQRAKCYQGASSFQQRCIKGGPIVLLLGDSHADHLLPGLTRSFPGINFIAVSAGGCRPLIDVVTRANAPECVALNRWRFTELITRYRYDAIVLSAAWEQGDAAPLGATLDRLRACTARLLVFGPIVQYRETVPMLLRTKGAQLEGFLVKDTSVVDRTIRDAAATRGVAYASVFEQLCGSGSCATMVDDQPMQWDDEHLTTAGSEWVIDRLRAGGRLEILESVDTSRVDR